LLCGSYSLLLSDHTCRTPLRLFICLSSLLPLRYDCVSQKAVRYAAFLVNCYHVQYDQNEIKTTLCRNASILCK
jgi:hypothetical protein